MITFNTGLGAINFLFDNKTAFEFIQLLEKMRNTAGVETIATNQHTKESCMLKMYSFFDNDYCSYRKKEIILWFSEETLEYAHFKLTQFLEKGDFYPSEFCDFIVADTHMVPKGNRIRQVPIIFLTL